MVRFSIQSLVTVAAAALPLLTYAAPTQLQAQAPARPEAGKTVPDSYIVVLQDSISDDDFHTHREWAAARHHSRLARRDDSSLYGIKHEYNFGNLRGYSGAFDASTIEEIKARDEVAFVEEDKIMVATGLTVQNNVPSWGLARISHMQRNDMTQYVYDSNAGKGVTAYVIDTGCNTEHVDFGGRASWGFNVIGGQNIDDVGHGTHVSGTIAGSTYGVAKHANIVAVKVLGSNGSGTNSDVVAGVQWVANDAAAHGRTSTSVVNMSLGGGYSAAVNQAVGQAISQGLTFVVAAGNDGTDASTSSPASVQAAITVGATDNTDTRAFYSNYGQVVDIFAPGSDIVSTWIGSTTAQHTDSGTSMATPHVTGLAAYLISLGKASGPGSVVSTLKALTRAQVSNPGAGTQASLAYNGDGQ